MRKLLLMIVLSLMLSSLTACRLDLPRIGVSAYPVAYLVKRIAKDKVNVVMLSEGTVMTRTAAIPDFKAEIDKLDVFFQMGQLEPYVSAYLSDLSESRLQVIDLVGQAGVYAFKRYTVSMVGTQEVTLIEPYYEGDAFASIDMYDTDPYLWLDPITMTSMASTIKKWLVSAYPEQTAFFETNYAQLEVELANLDANYQALKNAPIAIASLNPSFGSWQKAYRIHVYPIVLSRYGVLPNAQQLSNIINRMRYDGVTHIVNDPLMSEDMRVLYNSIKSELGLDEVVLHSLSFLTEADISAQKDYMTLMYENLNALIKLTK
jgi:ABC-type Zn uptake system ZnuABC Zn-binding protein ZnuA